MSTRQTLNGDAFVDVSSIALFPSLALTRDGLPTGIDAALDAIFEHPNMGPFLSQHLIRQMVTSNPSPAYIARMSRVFNDNGTGERGDLGALITAILMDPEARDMLPNQVAQYGAVEQPLS